MRTLRRIITAGASVAALVAASLTIATPASAARLVYTVGNVSAYEEYLYCSNTPGPCTLEGHGQLFVNLSLNTSHTQATVNFQLVDGTAHVGVDYYGPSTGVTTISATPPGVTPEVGSVDVPLYITGSGVSKTFTFHLTSASPSGDITSVGTETILPGNEIPTDCTLNYVNSQSKSIACTGRPAGQQWHFHMACFTGFRGGSANGNVVTGNGTSTATCGDDYTPAVTGLWVLN
jgi:hypothetical protein